MKVRGKSFELGSELPEGLEEAVKVLETELHEKSLIVEELEVGDVEGAKVLKQQAADGRLYRKGLETEALKLGALAKVVGEKPEDVKRYEKLLARYDVADLQTEIDKFKSMIPKPDRLDAIAGAGEPASRPERAVPASAFVV